MGSVTTKLIERNTTNQTSESQVISTATDNQTAVDINVNGIVNVRAKDLGTNKEQSITIKSSSGLSDEEVDQMVKDAEENAEADKKRREEIDLRNEADQLIFSTDKTIKDLDDKVTE